MVFNEASVSLTQHDSQAKQKKWNQLKEKQNLDDVVAR